jgi:D-aminoacyl-tRNA deacylase
MKALVQRVRSASVRVDGKKVGDINRGLLVFLGVDAKDNEAVAKKLVERVVDYRIFSDEQGKMNLSLPEVGGDMLVVSQFTLSADTGKGRRPSFSGAASPEQADALYRHFVECSKLRVTRVETGIFAADMQVSLINDGPVTFLLEAK